MVEQEAIACGASGMAAAMLESVGHGARLTLDDPLSKLARASFALHQELEQVHPDESGVDTGFRENPVMYPAFTADEIDALKPRVLELDQSNHAMQWLEGPDLWHLEPRLSRQALGALVCVCAAVGSYRQIPLFWPWGPGVRSEPVDWPGRPDLSGTRPTARTPGSRPTTPDNDFLWRHVPGA